MEKYGATICPACQSTDCKPTTSKEANDVPALDQSTDTELRKIAAGAEPNARVREPFHCTPCGNDFEAVRA